MSVLRGSLEHLGHIFGHSCVHVIFSPALIDLSSLDAVAVFGRNGVFAVYQEHRPNVVRIGRVGHRLSRSLGLGNIGNIAIGHTGLRSLSVSHASLVSSVRRKCLGACLLCVGSTRSLSGKLVFRCDIIGFTFGKMRH